MNAAQTLYLPWLGMKLALLQKPPKFNRRKAPKAYKPNGVRERGRRVRQMVNVRLRDR